MAAMPKARAAAGSSRATAVPATTIVPPSGVSAPVMMRINVDLPAPFSPTSACTSPGCRSKDTPRSAWTPAKALAIPVACRRKPDTDRDDSRTGLLARQPQIKNLEFGIWNSHSSSHHSTHPPRRGSSETVAQRYEFLIPNSKFLIAAAAPVPPSSTYQTKRSPNCVVRPSSALVMVPTVPFEMLKSGVPKFAWLSRLKISNRNSRRALFTGKRLLIDASTRSVPGPRTVLRPAVPWVPAAVTVYAVGSNQWSGVGLSMLPASVSRPGAKFTRWGTNDPHWHTLVEDTEYGKPDARRITPCSCHPPNA